MHSLDSKLVSYASAIICFWSSASGTLEDLRWLLGWESIALWPLFVRIRMFAGQSQLIVQKIVVCANGL